MTEPLKIRFSEIQTFLKCRRKHNYQWVQGLESRHQDDRLLLGTWGHEILKHLLLGKSEEEASKALAVEVEKHRAKQTYSDTTAYNEMAAIATHCAVKAARYFLSHYDPIYVEQTLEYEVKPNVYLTGTPDVVAKDKTQGMLWLFDHKFRNTFRPPQSEYFNLQMVFYSKLLQLVKNEVVVGSRQFQIKPFLPKIPSVNKDGSVSRKPITTDWETYLSTIKSVGANPNDYLDMKAKLQDVVFHDLDSCAALRNEEMLDDIWASEILPAIESIHVSRTGYLHPSRCFDFSSCNFCEMQTLCVAEMNHEDTSVMLRSLYKKRGEKSQFVIVDFEE